MMKEIALHIQDIAENSVRANASLIEITIDENRETDLFSVLIRDNGAGMDRDTMQRALDPFYTTKTVRKVGMGLSLFKQAAEQADGSFKLESEPGVGTTVTVTFKHSHFDRQPLGDMSSTIIAVLMGNPEIDIMYRHNIDNDEFLLDTQLIRETLEDISICEPSVLQFVRDLVLERQNLE